MNEKYLWVIGGGFLQIPLIREAQKIGLKTIVSDYNPNCPAKELSDIFLELDVFDIEAHLNYLRDCKLNISGVLAAGIDAPETMAAMNQELGLKGVNLRTALLVKNKDQFRLKLQELGYPTPQFLIIQDLDKIEEKLQTLHFPVIVKPTNNCGSRDMKIFSNYSDELITFIKQNLQKYKIVLVEQMWQGVEQTVECLVDIDSNFHRGFITDRLFTFENDYPIELGLQHPTQLSRTQQEELYILAENLAKDLNIEAGAVKLDTIYTADGPRVIELTVRHSGGFDCQYLVPRSTGKNILKAAILTAIQKPFEKTLLQDTLHKFGTTGSLWPKSGKITAINGLEDAKNIEGVEEIIVAKNVGEYVRNYTDCAARVLFIITTANTLQKAQEILKQAQDTIQIKIENVSN
ncbi:ATP-grasp domain-containing protein [Sulfurimonas sp.]|uniref:ATP-grasp domain-containing protein n=1 Tax=Sulfurimonas sp. TaxID=2022749 RepID=UPI003D0BE273